MKSVKATKGRKGQKGVQTKYDISFLRKICMEYQNGDLSLYQLEAKYLVSRQTICRWTKQFSSELGEEINSSPPMTTQEQQDVEALQKQIEALTKKLEYEQIRNFALETMVDLAKTELGIDVRKNFGAKQPKK
jgi:transposase-like protein